MDLDKTRVVAIMGDIDTGKTNLAVYIARQYKGKRKIWTLGYPKKIDDFPMLNSKNEIFKLRDSIIVVDELSKFFPTRERHTNQEFIEFSRISAHNNNTLIFTTQLTQDLTNRMEAFVDSFLITKMADLRYLKLGSKAKFTILDCADIRMNGHSLELAKGEYLEVCQANDIGENGVKTFSPQGIGKDWAVAQSCVELRRVAQSCAESGAESGAELRRVAQIETTLTLQETDKLNTEEQDGSCKKTLQSK